MEAIFNMIDSFKIIGASFIELGKAVIEAPELFVPLAIVGILERIRRK